MFDIAQMAGGGPVPPSFPPMRRGVSDSVGSLRDPKSGPPASSRANCRAKFFRVFCCNLHRSVGHPRFNSSGPSRSESRFPGSYPQ
jgi:hypothetical protein